VTRYRAINTPAAIAPLDDFFFLWFSIWEVLLLLDLIYFPTLGGSLQIPQLCIQSILGKKLFMGSLLNDPTLIQYKDGVCVNHRFQAVSNHNNGTPPNKTADRLLDLGLIFGIKG